MGVHFYISPFQGLLFFYYLNLRAMPWAIIFYPFGACYRLGNELIIIGNSAYSVVEKVQKFLGKEQTEKVIERVGTIPEGVFFAQEYSPRILTENGKILAIEFLRKTGGGGGGPAVEYKDKKQILKDQIKIQLRK